MALLKYIGTNYCCLKSSCSDSFFITMFLYITMAFRHLRDSMKIIFERNSVDEQNEESNFNNSVLLKLKYWTKQHQEILSASRDLIRLYIPVLFIYLVILFGNIIFSAFSVIESSDTHLITEWVLIIMFLFSNLGIFLIFCLAGDILTRSAEQVLDLAVWNNCRKEDKNHFLIIGQMVKKRLRVCILNTMDFDLSNSTFIWVLRSTLSYYIALVQIQDIHNKEE